MSQTKTKKRRLKYDPNKCIACRSCEIACAVEHSDSKDIYLAIKEESVSLPRVKVFASGERKNFPIACRHCDEPKCIEACISGALIKNSETGIIEYNKDKCIGCWMCVMACPYGAIRPIPKTKKVIRCDLCQDQDSPRCIEACPVKAIILEDK